MKYFQLDSKTPRETLETRLFILAGAFLFLYAVILTISTTARYHSWQVDYRWMHWSAFLAWIAGFVVLRKTASRSIPNRDPFILPIIAVLTGWGILTIFRLGSDFGLRQTIWFLISIGAIILCLRVPHILQTLRQYKYIWLTTGILLTGLTLFIGTYPNGEGPHLWLDFGGIYLQPSEPLKLLLIIFLAAYLADRIPMAFNFLQLLMPTLTIFAAALAILLVQRDMGTTTLFVVLYATVIYLASHRRRMLLISAVFITIAGFAGYQLFSVIRIRVESWLNPWLDPSGTSYQVIQSLLAVASGGVFGRGPGLGNPGLVPIVHSDFIFSAIAEETGLAGIVGLLILLGLLISRGMRTALQAPSQYQRYLSAGLTTFLAVQSILIIGGNLRLLPLTGVTLPFLSYGGSSLLTSYLCAGLILIVSHNSAEEEPAPLHDVFSYQFITAGLLLGLITIGLASGWWAIIRSGDLLARTDNARRGISDNYVYRGALLDQQDIPIVITAGEAGDLQRLILYAPLSPITGYNNQTYGQAGLEASLDGYLRGMEGNPSSQIWSSYLFYGQPPAGLDIRLSINLSLQQQADALFGEHSGALILLNAESGEILAMVSHPYVDSNELEENWAQWISDPSAPLLNRATQGLYPIGSAIGPFLLSAYSEETLPVIPDELMVTNSEGTYPCARFPQENITWKEVITGGCPAAVLSLGQNLDTADWDIVMQNFGIEETPEIPLEVASPVVRTENSGPSSWLFGSSPLQVTPLQMALAAAALSNGNERPSPRIAIAVDTILSDWVVLPTGDSTSLTLAGVGFTTSTLASQDFPGWETLGLGGPAQSGPTWYLSGTLPSWQGMPLALALVLEEYNPVAAQQIGQSLLQTALTP